MPSKVREQERDRDRDRDSPRSKEKHKSKRSNRKSPQNVTAMPERSATLTSPSTKRRTSMPVPDVELRASSTSPRGSKTSLPYPSFSKAHSKEAISSRDNVVNPRLSLYTPDPTDLNQRKLDNGADGIGKEAGNAVAPPSPPLTAVEPQVTGEGSDKNDLQKRAEEIRKRLVKESGPASGAKEKEPTPRSQTPKTKDSFWRFTKGEDRSTLSSSRKSRTTTPITPVKTRPKRATVDDASSITGSPARSAVTDTNTAKESTPDSDATSIAPHQHTRQQPFSPSAHEPPATQNSGHSPRATTATNFSPSRKQTPAVDVFVDRSRSAQGGAIVEDSPMPPPPPPAPAMPFQAPRVDYLMQHGGLNRSIPRTLLGNSQAPQPPLDSTSSSRSSTCTAPVEHIFAPFHSLLDDYTKVMSKNGSLAVATGYRSIARRLLDRLEAVFARDISSEVCACQMCQDSTTEHQNIEEQHGVSWGEVLEYVCGRQELPQWPAFGLGSTNFGLGISATETKAPMQKLDVDVPDEYRDHYIRQSKKTKQTVDDWLASQPDNPSSPPQDVDDETLTFAILTQLEPERRPIFKSLVGVGTSRPASRLSTPHDKPETSKILNPTSLAIQRLYRLANPPREPESAVYLLSNPAMHNVLATLAAISDGEWEILTSGRFDGFLRSGAEDIPSPPAPALPRGPQGGPSRGPTPFSRGTTPFSRGPTPFSRAATPASAGAPVAMDEENEIATLAEVEREIFLGMEALEDAFEALHLKAENVRQALRERGAGLSVANQARRGVGSNLEARMGTPASLGGAWGGWESETDDGIDDAESDLAPDDSASNFSRRRRRGKGRRHERKTPAPVTEEDEGEGRG